MALSAPNRPSWPSARFHVGWETSRCGRGVSVTADRVDAETRLRNVYDRMSEIVDAEDGGRHFFHIGYHDLSPGVPRRPWPFRGAPEARLLDLLIADKSLDSQRVLEAGCGRGGNSVAINHWFDGVEIVGLDISLRGLQSASQRMDRLINADAQRLPIRDDSFDAVFCVESAAHYPRRELFFAEVQRVLRTGGLFFYGEPLLRGQRADVITALDACGLDLVYEFDATSGVNAQFDLEFRRGRLPGASGRWWWRLLISRRQAPADPTYWLAQFAKNRSVSSSAALAAMDEDLVHRLVSDASRTIEIMEKITRFDRTSRVT